MIDFVFRIVKSYYPQVFLEECKFVVKETKMPVYITGDIEISSDSGRDDSDKENSSKKNSDKENFDEEN